MATETQVLVLLPLSDRHKKIFENAAPSAIFTYSSREEATPEMYQAAEVIIGNPPIQMVRDSKKLKWIQLESAGADRYVQDGALPPGTLLTNATGAYGLAISEYMLGVLLTLFKKLHLYRDNQQQNHWKDEGDVRSVYGSTVLIVGLGDIGGEFAKRVKALGAYTIGIRRSNTSRPDYIDELYLMDQLDTMLERADVVAICLPGTSETRHLFTSERIARIKKGAVLINVGRGTVIDTEALCDALQSGHLSGAALDVTDPEPLPADHRLWSIESAVITPHVSGGYHLYETFERIVGISTENLRRYVSGEPLKNRVDFSTGYRASV